ncbi:MAG: medium chain dehydrogenase/reductase family protein [Pseudomonadota bacterium]|nr:medium chain dehydrogenase/reductase family protein [Pseudomonadota bacterium]
MYRRVELTAFGGPEKLVIKRETALPEPGVGELRVKVLAAGTGFTDTIIRQGQYVGVKEKPPFTPGYDWFGVVDAVGDGVSDFAVGDAVADMPVIGGYTEYLCVPASQVVPAPPNLDAASAVCMILSYTTAYQMLTREANMREGQSCLIHAAGGAVGTALLELGRHMGLKMYGTGSAFKKEVIERFGATHIDYRSSDFEAEIKRLTGGEGVDAVFDTIGGKNWSRSYRCLKSGGCLVGFGALQLTTGEESVPSVIFGFAKLLGLWKLLPDGKKTRFYNIQTRREKQPDDFIADVSALFAMLAAGELQPVIAERARLDDIIEIHQRLDRGEIAGKVVLEMA